MAKKSTTAKINVPAELNKAIVLFIAGIIAVLVSRTLNGVTGDLLAIFGIVFFIGAFYFILVWSGLWAKLKK